MSLLLFFAVVPRTARAENPRGVGYVLSFRLGVEADQARLLVERLASATTDWHGMPSQRGADVSRNCASTPDCIRGAAKALGVSRVGIVAVVAAAGVVRLDVRLIDAKTGNEIQRTNTEYKIAAGADAAEDAIFDLIPRLLPGEKAAPSEARVLTEPAPAKRTPELPKVAQIREESPALVLEEVPPTRTPSASGTRWWLWGGLGAAAATITIVALVVTSGGEEMDLPVLELPPPR